MINLDDKISELLNELDAFVTTIEEQPEISIHGIRKRSKYIRALLKFNQDFPPNLGRSMHMINRIVAPYREAGVMLGTYKQLTESPHVEPDPSLEASLYQNPFIVNPVPHEAVIDTIHKLLLDFRLQMRISTTEISLETIHDHLEDTYQSGKRLFRQAQTSSESQLLHNLRKKTKRLWYQLRLLYGDELAEPDHPLNQSQELGIQLGLIHDLDIFIDMLVRENRTKLFAKAQEPRLHLLKQSLLLGTKLYVPTHISHHFEKN
ncbi:MAG: CHAD domain-containing protein [Candidatus Marinimicrobia bacterium]|nr:CHAD domain-containing protein [Candidatus Neomarinimicrobiota bacterium]